MNNDDKKRTIRTNHDTVHGRKSLTSGHVITSEGMIFLPHGSADQADFGITVAPPLLRWLLIMVNVDPIVVHRPLINPI